MLDAGIVTIVSDRQQIIINIFSSVTFNVVSEVLVTSMYHSGIRNVPSVGTYRKKTRLILLEE